MVKRRNKSVFDDPFASSARQSERKENAREERTVKESMPLLCLNFKDFDHSQCPPGQTYDDWQKSGKLAKLMVKFEQVCQMTRAEAASQGVIGIYGKFPERGDFKQPSYIQGKVEWGTIKNIGGQQTRLAGYFIGHVFYPVFLDEKHRFYPSEKKHT